LSADFFKIFFITDIHASTVCFRKFINSSRREKPPAVLIIGGDITGKVIVPFIESVNGSYTIPFPDRPLHVAPEDVDLLESEFARSGCYVYKCDDDSYKRYKFGPTVRREVAKRLQIERLNEWLAFADERLKGKNIKLIINCGNDDPFYIDEVLRSHPSVTFPENKVIDLNDQLQLLSIGYSTPTPWNVAKGGDCEREMEESQLQRRIEDLVAKATRPYVNCIFNFHCPPLGTQLDLAPRLDATLRPQVGIQGAEFAHVGSSSVLSAINDFQPALSLHGHVHEQHCIEQIKATPAVNPGSSYWSGFLQGAIASFKGDRLVAVHLTSERFSDATYEMERKLGFTIAKLVPFVGDSVDLWIEHPHLKEIKDDLAEVRRSVEELRRDKGTPPKESPTQEDDRT